MLRLAGTVIDHVVEILSEAPFPTHKPVAADLAIDALRDTWQVLRLPRPFPVGSLVAVDGEPLQMHSRLSGVQAILAAGDPERAYEIWTALAELARLCRRGGFGISPFHFGRAVVPALATRTFKGQCVRGDLDFQRLEKARSGLAELCAQWEASIRAGTQQYSTENLVPSLSSACSGG